MEHVYQRRVQFADTDAAGVVHFSRILCYVEEAEHELFLKLAIPLLEGGGWPRVHVECDYTAPAKPGDVLSVSLSPAKLGHSSILWAFAVTCDGSDVAQGSIKTVRVDEQGNACALEDHWRLALAG